MNDSVHVPGPPTKPTVPGRDSRLVWAIVAAGVLALLLICAVLVLIAAWRGP